MQALMSFATEGLRTLVVTKREISEAVAHDWLDMYKAAQAAVGRREEALAEAAATIEVDLEPLGLTAIEDRLQVSAGCMGRCAGWRSELTALVFYPHPVLVCCHGCFSSSSGWGSGVHSETVSRWLQSVDANWCVFAPACGELPHGLVFVRVPWFPCPLCSTASCLAAIRV